MSSVNDTELLALTLRIRALSTLICGQPVPSASNQKGAPFAQRYETLLSRFHAAIATQPSESLKRFIDNYEQNAPLLELSLPASNDPNMSIMDKATLLLEAESDIMQLDRDLREIANLESQGLAEVGKLGDAEGLEDQLKDVMGQVDELEDVFGDLEERVVGLLDTYDAQINGISETFIKLNQTVTEAELSLKRLQKEAAA